MVLVLHREEKRAWDWEALRGIRSFNIRFVVELDAGLHFQFQVLELIKRDFSKTGVTHHPESTLW